MRLKQSTIFRAFKKRGFQEYKGTLMLVQGQTTSSRLFVNFDAMIVIRDARWVKAPNVHIVSYWAYPKTVQELAKMLDQITLIYSELCGTKF